MTDQLDQSALAPDPDAVVPRIKMGEIGFTGLKQISKQLQEEANLAFRYPQFLKVVQEMRDNPTVAAAMLVYKMMIGKVAWSVQPPIGATEKQIERAKFIESCMTDMEHTWGAFVTELLTYLEYGFSVHEKVFRRRLVKNGSKYNDGLVGIRKLPPRSQTTRYGWDFSDDGRTLTGYIQTLANVYSPGQYAALMTDDGNRIHIPREKFLLFRADCFYDNPEGRSLYKNCYIAYKQLQLIQDQELIGISRDLGGIPCFGIPPRYLDPNATPEDQAVYQSFVKIGENLTTAAQSSVVMPLMYDPDSKLPVFTMELLESKGGKNFDTSAIIQRLQNDILTALNCDVIRSGEDNNFSLAGSQTNLLSLSLAYRLNEIKDVLNNDLIPALFAANGWTDTDLPKFITSDFDKVSLEELSKFIQRVASVGVLEVDRPVLNVVREAMGVAPKPDDEEPDQNTLSGNSSRSGDSFSTDTGGLNGTSNTVAPTDTSSINKENSA